VASERPELVVLDLAGTTVRDRGEVPATFTAVLAAEGIALPPDGLAAVRGASKREVVRALLPPGPECDARAERVFATFRERLAARYRDEGVEPVAGADELLRALRARDVRVAFNTGFDGEITALLLASLGWDHGIADAVVCGDDVRAGRPAPYLIFHAMERTGIRDVRRVAVVGDTVLDLEAGHNARVAWNVGVLTGAHDRARLATAPHTHLLASVAELKALWG
jgi:phosphonatase-like hydrolase